jgi:hypothetical protein
MATVSTPMILLPGHTPATHEKGINPDDDKLMQWTPNTIAPKTPMVRTRPELLRAYSLRSPAAAGTLSTAMSSSSKDDCEEQILKVQTKIICTV